jgi:hypothetical protein
MASTIKRVTLHNARTGGTDDVPVEPHINGGSGITHYLQKTLGGKRVYYRPEEWRYMTEAERQAARIVIDDAFGPQPGKTNTEDAEAVFSRMGEQERASFLAKFAPAKGEDGKRGGK